MTDKMTFYETIKSAPLSRIDFRSIAHNESDFLFIAGLKTIGM